MSEELRRAAEEVVEAGSRALSGAPCVQISRHLWDCCVSTARAYLAEHPADDGEPVTEEWLRDTFGPHLASCPWTRYALHVATDKLARAVGWCPRRSGHQPECLCINEWVVIERPTRGHVRRLLAALGSQPPARETRQPPAREVT
jgi:hypothetical protein